MYGYALALATCLGTLGLSVAPVPSHLTKEPTLYFPTKIGAKWVYNFGEKERTEVVTAVERKAKEQAWLVTTGRVDKAGKVRPEEKWEVSERGLFLVESYESFWFTKKWEPPCCYLKLPHVIGAKWDPLPPHFQDVAVKPQRLKVPAGEFDAVGVETYWETGGLLVRRWYAPGVGLVKNEDENRTICVLKSFTLSEK